MTTSRTHQLSLLTIWNFLPMLKLPNDNAWVNLHPISELDNSFRWVEWAYTLYE